MRGTSSALVIEQPLHLWVPWRAWGSKYGPVENACLKRENAVSDMQISHIGTQEYNQTSNA